MGQRGTNTNAADTREGRGSSPRPFPCLIDLLYLIPYFRRSFRLPFFSFIFPRRWSARPLAFVSLSPVRAPAASFIWPLALSMAPSSLSRRPLPTCSSSARECPLLTYPEARESNACGYLKCRRLGMNVHRPRAKHHRRSLAPPYSTAKG